MTRRMKINRTLWITLAVSSVAIHILDARANKAKNEN